MAGQIIARGEKTWLVRVFEGRDPQTGKRVYHNKTIHGTKKAAQKYLNAALRERDLGTFASATDTSMASLLDALLLDYETNAKSHAWAALVVRVHLRPFFGAMKAARVGTDQIQTYVAKRREPTTRALPKGRTRKIGPASNATINRELSLLRRAYSLGKKATPPKVTSAPAIPMLAENNVRKGFFEADAFTAIRRALPDEIQPVVTFAYYTGCRKGEVLNLRWNQVDLSERLVRLEPGETKNDEARTVFMVPELYEILAIQREIRDRYFPECPWVFARAGKQIRDFKGAWKTACKSAGLLTDDGEPDKLFHDLRRTGVRNLVRAGVPEAVAMRISGHKTRAVFDRYNIVNENDLKDAARRLSEYLAAPKVTPADRHAIGTQQNSTAVN
ncbi:MAG: site-specific integrase [Bryobacteraceae bacterium]